MLPDANPRRNPEDRHGQFLIRQLKPEHRRILHEITLTSQAILQGDDLEGGQPLQRGDISYFSLWLMMSALADMAFKTFMDQYAPLMGYEISWDKYHEFKLDIEKVLKDNEHINADNFLDIEEPDLVDDDPNTPLPDLQGQGSADPGYKNTIESLNIEDKHIILESDDDKFVECTLKWSVCATRMFSKRSKRALLKKRQDRKKKKRRLLSKKKKKIHRSHMYQLEALVRKRNQLHLNAPQRRRNQGRRRQTFKMMRQLLK